MVYRYAQIRKDKDGYGYVECDSYLSGEVILDNMIPLEENFLLENKRWNYGLKLWEDYEPEPEPPEPQESNTEKILKMVEKSQDEIRQEGADMVMEEMKKRGLIV